MIDSLSSLAWREPSWLLLGLFPWGLWGLRLLTGFRRGRGYADPGLLPWARAFATPRTEPRRMWRPAMLAMAWLLFALAMAGPRLAETSHDQEKKDYAELVVVLDVSRSMTARDVEPSRLERAKLELHDLVERADRLKIGLVVYAARPHLLNPPTDDKSVLRRNLQLIHHGLLPTEGSSLEKAVEFSVSQFSGYPAARAILLVTDGELPAEGAVLEAALEDAVIRLAQQGVVLYALGVGTPEGAPLLARQGGWLRHQGEAVVSRLHEDRLQAMAILGNGRYARVSATDSEWRSLYDQGIRQQVSGSRSGQGSQLMVWRELYYWFLIPGALLMLLAHVDPRRMSLGSAPVLVAVFVYGILDPGTGYAMGLSRQQEAFQAYDNESYQEARQTYTRVAGYAGRMGEAGSAYKLGEYREAVQLFTQAVLDAGNDAQRADAVFNLANSHYKLEDYEAAIELYREVQRYVPGHPAAELNLELAVAMLERQRASDERVGSARQGQGPRSARVEEGVELTGGSVSFDEQADGGSPDPAGMPADGPLTESELVGQGIHYSRPALEHGVEFVDPGWDYAATTVERILLQGDTLAVDEAVLWRRMFETEEGFPAPLEAPYELPDVAPW